MISVFGSLVGNEEIAAVAEVMKSQWMGFGKKVDEFEGDFKAKFGLENFALVDSGSNALYMAIKLLDLPVGSHIIVPSFTWVSCAQAVMLAGCVPIFCDVDINTMNVTKETVAAAITRQTSAIMVVHYAGLPVEMDEIMSLGYPVIEDAAHAVASTYRGKPCGCIGTIGIYSFDAVKNLTVGEGGGITSPNPRLIDKAKVLRYCGIGKSGFDSSQENKNCKWWEYSIEEPFIKMLPTNIAAAIGIEQIKKIDSLQARRKAIWDTYSAQLRSIREILLPVDPKPYATHSYFTYCIRCQDRDQLAARMLEAGIYTTLRYHPLHLNSLYGQTQLNLQNSQQLNTEALSIPIHPRLTDGEVAYVLQVISDFYN